MNRMPGSSGNVFFALFGAVGLVGVLGASMMGVMNGPVTSMQQVTKRTIAENAMIAAGKLTIMKASQPGGDCDGDNVVEPPGFVAGGTAPHPHGGGLLPSSVGAAKQDPWGNEFGYCVWDHGDAVKAGTCPDDAARLSGRQDGAGVVVAVISSGPDRIFQTSCNNEGAGDYVDKSSGSDDIVMSYTYNEARVAAGGSGLWLPVGDDGAEIQRDLSVTADDGSGPVFAVDNSAGAPSIKVDFIQQLSAGAVEFLSSLRGTDATLSGDLNVTGAATLGDTDVAGDLSATGAATFGSAEVAGNLGVSGSTTLEGLTAGATSVGTLTAAGLANLHGLSVTNAATIGGAVNVTGMTNLLSGLAVDGDTLFVDAENNRVGLGTNAPQQLLHLKQEAASAVRLLIENTAVDANAWTFYKTPNREWMAGVRGEEADAFQIIDHTDTAVRLNIEPDGNIGIGTITPSALLDVAGTAEINGQLDLAGFNIVNLAVPTGANDAANKGYVDAQVAAGTGFVEQDPEVGTLESGKWCNSDGTVITCTDDLPLPPDSDILANMTCHAGEIPLWDGSAWVCAGSGAVADPCETGPVGTVCLDGAVYAGELNGTRLYAAPADESGTLTWNNGTSNWTVSGATSLTDGLSNTNILVDLADGGAPYAAAEDCRARGAGWYLPARGELNVLYTNNSTIGGFDTSGSLYWSSSETNSGNARVQRFSDGAQGNFLKDSNALLVRCIRQGGPSGGSNLPAAGDDGQVQYNSDGTLAGDDGFTYDGAGSVTIDGAMTAAAFAGDGSGLTGINDTLSGLTCASGEIAKWDGSAWACAPDNNTGTDTSCTGGAETWAAFTAPEANKWRSITYGNGMFVAVASDGTNRIMTSSDGVTWTPRAAPENNQWQIVTHGGGLFVAVAWDGTNRIMTSPDGITWTPRAAPGTNSWRSITYGGGMFVAVAGGGTDRIMTSPDGINWTARTAPGNNNWRTVTWGDGLFVAVAYGVGAGTDQIMTSPDGVTWTPRTALQGGWNSVTYGDGLFVAVGLVAANQIMTSPDGVAWTARAAPEANRWLSVTHGDGLFVAVANNGTNRIMTSPDGVNWTARAAPEADSWVSVAYGGGQFAAVAWDGTNRIMAASAGSCEGGGLEALSCGDGEILKYNETVTAWECAPDGGDTLTGLSCAAGEIVKWDGSSWTCAADKNDGTEQTCTDEDWTAIAPPEANGWRAVTYGNGLFVAVTIGGTNRITTSPDGVTWTARAAPEANNWWSVTYGDGLFVAVANTGTNRIMTSPDGVNWTARAAPENNGWESVTWGSGLFVALADTGTNRIMTSPDGVSWTAQAAPENNQWAGVTYGGGLFVAVARGGTNRIMTSPDGITWTARAASENNNWRGVTYGDGMFVAVASNGSNRIMTSPDGVTWTARGAPESNSWYGVTYGDGMFVAVAEIGGNRIMTSPDGITWTARTAPEANYWHGVTYGSGLFVAVAVSGTNQIMTWEAPICTGGGDNLGDHTATTDLDLDGNAIVNLADPTNAQDAATKAYVDAAVADCETGPVGTVCPDGAVYAGDTVGGARMYVADADESGGLTWNNGTSNWIATGATSSSDGLSNTDILAELSDVGAPYEAANACRSKGEDWYLPAKDELAMLYSNRAELGSANLPTSSSWYWSSTESGVGTGWIQRFSTGNQSNFNKSNLALVRCARRAPGGDNLGDHTATTDLDLDGNDILDAGTVAASSFAGSGASLTSLNGSNIASGTVSVARIGTGIKNATTFYRGDGTFAVPPSGADNLGNHVATTTLRSDTNNTDDLGTSSLRWRNAYLSGTVNSNGIITKSTATTGYNESILAINGTDPSSYPASNSGGTFINTQTTGSRNSAVYGETITGIGIVGYQDNGDYNPTVPSAAGGYFVSDQPTGATYGAYGQSTSSSGRGVYGIASSTSGINYGVYGRSLSSSGYGVYGQADSPTGYGVYSAGRMHSTGTLTVSSNIINDLPSSTYDVWIQGGTASSGDARNLAILGQSDLDALYINYFSEYAGGTYIGGPVSIIGSSGTLSVADSVTATAYYQSSDRSLKTDIETIADPFALLSGIEGKHFLWKDSGKGAYGVIAQDVAAVMPEAVSENDDGYMTVEYSQLIGPLIEAVKQLKSEIEELRADNDNLHAANDNLREEVHALKAGGD